MRFRGFFCAGAVAMAILVAVGYVAAQQSGQTGTGTTSGTTSNTNAGSANANTGTNTNNTVNNPTIRSRTNTNPDNQNQTRRQQSPLMISGKVVLDDGSPAPMGTVIVRDCGGRTMREANVAPDGGFGFQLGGNNNLMPDSSDGTFAGSGDLFRSSSPSFTIPDEGPGAVSRLVGCELRAQIGGYRSSTITFTSFPAMGIMEVGTIVLYPTVRVAGTTVSVTNLAAPKNAKKALERAEKAYRKKNLDEAEKQVRIALRAYPGFASAWLQLGRVYGQSHRVEEARSAFLKAMEADGKYVSPLIEMARLAAMESKWQEAANLSDHALDLDPLDFPNSYYINAVAHYNLNELGAAERSARKLERLDGLHRWPQVHLVMANILRRKKDLSGEVDELRSYLKNAPQSSIQDQVRSRIRDLENGRQ